MSESSLDTIVDNVRNNNNNNNNKLIAEIDPLDTIEPAGPDRVQAAESYSTCDPLTPVRLRMADEGVAAREPLSLPTAVKR